MMRLVVLVLALCCAGVFPAWADYAQGAAAFDRKDWPAAFAELKPLADQGDPRAMGRLGHMMMNGLGTPRNEAAALVLLQRAADGGDAIGQNALATAYLFGRGAPRDVARGLSWLEKSVNQNLPEALHNMGELFFNGYVVGRDEARAVGYYQRGADAGVPASQEQMAVALWSGRGTAMDKAKAAQWARKAADNGRPLAQTLLGVAYWTGQGIERDLNQAVLWFRRGAEQGNSKAQHNLAVALTGGRGVDKDERQAYFWHVLATQGATAADRENFTKLRDEAAAKLAPDIRQAVEAEAKAWRPKSQNPTISLSPSRSTTKTMSGSGVLVGRDGTVLTNQHVVSGCRAIRVTDSDGKVLPATLAAEDAVNDLAALKTSLTQPVPEVARFRQDKPLRSGDEVVVVGFPLSSLLSREPNVTAGVVSALAGIRGDKRHYQVTAPVQKGNSGGPLADMSGNVVGIVSSKLNASKVETQYGDLPQNINFAIKSEIAREFLDRNGLRYETAPSTATLSAADVGERIKKVTMFVECQVSSGDPAAR